MTSTYAPFELLHCDLWTSPVLSMSGYKYYPVVVDDFTHYMWTFPLRAKSEVHRIFVLFQKYVSTHFSSPIKFIQCDNGTKFTNNQNRDLFLAHGIVLRFSCPYTSPQNGNAERALRTTNDVIRSLLIQASTPLAYWVEARRTATFLINLRPYKPNLSSTPYFTLHQSPPPFASLWVFGCLCYPNLTTTSPHKLAPRYAPCVFHGYPDEHRGYRCLDLATGRVIISRHVTFDETSFPFANRASPPSLPHTPTQPSHTTPTFKSTPTTSPPSPPASKRTPLPTSPITPPSSPSSIPSTDCTSTASTPLTSPLPENAIPVSVPQSPHPMTTRAKRGFGLPALRLNLLATTPSISPIPKTYRSALHDPNWTAAMHSEFEAFLHNDTWDLVPRPAHSNVVSGKWIFRHKFHVYGSLARYKARWVCRGYSQQPGIDYDETFSPVVKPSTIRTVLSMVVSSSWPIHQLDVKNAFLHGSFSETVYCQQPQGFENPSFPNHVCHLKNSLYGLKQAPRAWFSRFATFILSTGFTASKSDSSLFIFHSSTDIAYLLLYVDDIILTASPPAFLNSIIDFLRSEFAMIDLGALHHFLEISVTRSPSGRFLSQQQYVTELIDRAGMTDCNTTRTPIDTSLKLDSSGPCVSDPSFYRSIAGALQYATLTRPDISYAVQQACLYMHDPREPHLNLVKRIICYLKATSYLGLQLNTSSPNTLTSYSDADWAGCPETRRSTSGFCFF